MLIRLIQDCMVFEGNGGGDCYGYGTGHMGVTILFETFGPVCANGASHVSVTEPPPTDSTDNCFENQDCTCCYETSGAYTCSGEMPSTENCLQSTCTCCYETTGEVSCY